MGEQECPEASFRRGIPSGATCPHPPHPQHPRPRPAVAGSDLWGRGGRGPRGAAQERKGSRGSGGYFLALGLVGQADSFVSEGAWTTCGRPWVTVLVCTLGAGRQRHPVHRRLKPGRGCTAPGEPGNVEMEDPSPTPQGLPAPGNHCQSHKLPSPGSKKGPPYWCSWTRPLNLAAQRGSSLWPGVPWAIPASATKHVSQARGRGPDPFQAAPRTPGQRGGR